MRPQFFSPPFLLVLIALTGTITSCLLLGFGPYWKEAAVVAVIVFVAAMIILLAGTWYYIREVMALSSVQNEARDSRFMDPGATRGILPRQNQM